MSHIYIQKIFNSNKIKLIGTPYYIIGESIAARHTSMYIEGLNIMLDCGKYMEKNPSNIFITHSHSDHVKDLPSMLIEPSKQNINIIIPQPEIKHIREYIESYFRMTKYSDKFDKIWWNLIGVSIQKDINSPFFMDKTFKINNSIFKIELFKCTHTIPTTGYGFIEIRQKLKDEYIGSSKLEIENFKKTGTEITRTVEVPLFCYLGDTTHHVFYKNKECTEYNPHIEKYKNIITECTFYEEEDIKHAKDKKHTHWNNINKYIAEHPENNFILYHFSMKYKPYEVSKFFKKQINYITNELYVNINLLIHEFEDE